VYISQEPQILGIPSKGRWFGRSQQSDQNGDCICICMHVCMYGWTYVRTYVCMYRAKSKISQHICGVDWGWTATESIVTKIARNEKCRSVYHPLTIRLPSIWNCKAPMASTSVTGDPLVKTAMGHLEAVETSQLGSSCMPRRVRREFVESWLGEMDCGL